MDAYCLNRCSPNKGILIQKVIFLAEDQRNPVNVIHRNKFIIEMLPTALICHSKTPKVLMQSDMPFGLCSSAKKSTVISLIQADEL